MILVENGMVVLGLATPHQDSKITGTFAQQLGWAFVGPCHPSAHGPPAKLRSLHLFRWFTHTHVRAIHHAKQKSARDIHVTIGLKATLHMSQHSCKSRTLAAKHQRRRNAGHQKPTRPNKAKPDLRKRKDARCTPGR